MEDGTKQTRNRFKFPTNRITVRLPVELEAQLNQHLAQVYPGEKYRKNRFIVDAIRQKLDRSIKSSRRKAKHADQGGSHEE